MLARARVAFALPLIALGFASCEIRHTPALITVYNPSLKVSFPLPQGWTADEATLQAGFHMQTFTGRSVDVSERAGIRAQVLGGPMPDGVVDDVAERFRGELNVEVEETYELEGRKGKFWSFLSDDGEESSRLMLTDVDGTLYGLYVRGEARTLEASKACLPTARIRRPLLPPHPHDIGIPLWEYALLARLLTSSIERGRSSTDV